MHFSHIEFSTWYRQGVAATSEYPPSGERQIARPPSSMIKWWCLPLRETITAVWWTDDLLFDPKGTFIIPSEIVRRVTCRQTLRLPRGFSTYMILAQLIVLESSSFSDVCNIPLAFVIFRRVQFCLYSMNGVFSQARNTKDNVDLALIAVNQLTESI